MVMNEYELYTRILSANYLAKDQQALIETKSKKPQRAAIVNKRNLEYTLYRYDLEKSDFLPFFNKVHPGGTPDGLTQFCDYVLLVRKSDRLYVLLIEMKSGSAAGADLQLKASETFMEYIKNSAQRISARNGYCSFTAEHMITKRIVLGPRSNLSRPTTNVRNAFDSDPIKYFSDSFDLSFICQAQ